MMDTPAPRRADRRPSRSYWTVGAGRGEIRTGHLGTAGDGEAVVRTLCTGISRGTETLVHDARVPPSVYGLMNAPFQEGTFPSPVKYGYLSVGVVEEGPGELVGQRVFCLYPHQDRYIVPVDALTLVPSSVPSERALLAGAVETALNALWDTAPRFGDRIAVVGGGMIGLAVTALLAQFPLQRLQLVDTDPSRRALAQDLGAHGVQPDEALGECDIVYHCSSTAAGLARGLELLGDEGELMELSWFGQNEPAVPLGAAFHARRLSIRASQVGAVAAPRRARRTHGDRLKLALEALRDPRFDSFLTGSSPFDELPQVMNRLADGSLSALCHVITYPAGERTCTD